MKLMKTFFGRILKDLQHKQLIPLKILFFVHASTILVLYPYLTIHMRELGINVEETAIMSAVTPVVAIIMPPIAGMIADKIGNFKLLLAISSAMSGAFALLLLLVPVGRMTVAFPPRVELTASCSSESLVMSMYQEYPCDLVHPYTVDVATRVESCGFACRSPVDSPTAEYVDALLFARSYAVKLRADAGSTAVYRYALPAQQSEQDSRDEQHSLRKLANNENYTTIVRRLSDNTYFFPTSNLFKMECDQEVEPDEFMCRLGGKELNLEGREFNELVKYLTRLSVNAVDTNADRVSIYQVQMIADLPTEVKSEPEFSNLTCQDGFSKVLDLSVEVPVYNPDNHQEIYKSLELTECVSSCITTAPRDDLCSNPSQHIELDPSLTFWTYLSVRMFLGVIGGTAFAMFEGAVIAILRDQNADYGLQRIYGSIGGMISSPLSGMLIDYASKGKGYTDFRPAFYLYAGLKILSGALMMAINLEFKTPSTNIVDDVITVLKNIEMAALFIACFILGTAWGYIESFLFWLLQDMGASRSLMGVTITVGGIAGLPLLVMSGPIIKRIGHANVLFIGFVFYAVRLLGYSLINNPWLCLVFEAMEGVTSSLAFTAAVTYAARLSTTTTDTSVQGLLGGVYFGVGKGSGSLIGGYLMKAFGTRTTYQIFSAATFLSGCVYFLFNRLYLAKRPQTEGNDICKKLPKVKTDDIEGCDKISQIDGIPKGKCSNVDIVPSKELNANVKLYLDIVDKSHKHEDNNVKSSIIESTIKVNSKDANHAEINSVNVKTEMAPRGKNEPSTLGVDNPAFEEYDKKIIDGK